MQSESFRHKELAANYEGASKLDWCHANRVLADATFFAFSLVRPWFSSTVLIASLVLLLAAVRLPGAQSYIGASFTGAELGVTSFSIPSDAAIAAGPTEVVEFVNGRFTVYRKRDGQQLRTSTDSNFWFTAGVKFPRRWDVTDPRIVFDAQSRRWFAVEIDYDEVATINTNRFLLGVSEGTNATGAWKAVAIPVTATGKYFADFPTLGLDAHAVYLAADLFPLKGGTAGTTLVALPKQDLLAPTPIATNITFFGPLSSAANGIIVQPAVCMDNSGQGQMLSTASLGFNFDIGAFETNTTLVNFAVENAAGPGKATLTPSTFITVPEYTAPINPPQPDGTDNLDNGDARFSSSVHCVGGVLYAVHGTQVDDRSAIRWYRIDATTKAVLEAGTLADPELDYFYPAIAANNFGKVVIGFNGCGPSTFITCYAVVGETVGGVTRFGEPMAIKAGADSYQNTGPDGTSRWGDYTAACVDASDPNRFWLLQQFPSSVDIWTSQITEIVTTDLRLNITTTGDSVTLSWPELPVSSTLQQSPLTGPLSSWSTVTQSPATNAGVVSVSLPVTPDPRLFRLVTEP